MTLPYHCVFSTWLWLFYIRLDIIQPTLSVMCAFLFPTTAISSALL